MIFEFIYIAFCIWLAKNNATRIKKGKKINHKLNGGIHILASILAGCLIHWVLFPLILLTARIFFNSALNLFRNLDLFYVSPDPKSWVDIMEKNLCKSGVAWFVFYSILWLGFNLILI